MSGSLQIKNEIYYMVINYKDENGKRKQKWISTNLSVKGNNKKKASILLRDTVKEYEDNKMLGTKKMLFADFMDVWLENMKSSIRQDTFFAYSLVIHKHIIPYFKDLNITIQEINQVHIQKYYNLKLITLSANTVLKHHANIHKALDYAVHIQLINHNPSDYVMLPKKKKFIGKFYDSEQIKELLVATKDTPIEIPVMLSAYYGFRRSEVLGLKWTVIDFENNTIEVNHTAIKCAGVTIYDDTVKTKSSFRILPLEGEMKRYLKSVYIKQKEHKILFGSGYNDNEYVCKWENGELLKPDFVSHKFKDLIKKNNLPSIRFHDLRHSSATMLLKMGFSLKEIQEWLGHSDISTTSNIYAHLQYESKINMANKMNQQWKIMKC